MNVKSKLITIDNNNKLSSEYIENELRERGVSPLRWAIVDINEDNCVISVADFNDSAK